jgi:hypothetical protein
MCDEGRAQSSSYPARNRDSLKPDHCDGEIDEAFEVNCSAIVSGGEAAEMFHSIKAALDAVAIDVDEFIVRDDDLAQVV